MQDLYICFFARNFTQALFNRYTKKNPHTAVIVHNIKTASAEQ